MKILESYASMPNECTLRLTESDCTLDDGVQISYTTYGIELLDAGQNTVLSYEDVSTDRSFVEGFAHRCLEHQAYPEHIADLLEDYLE